MAASLLELFQRGGPVMWPILVCSITALAITLERLWVLARAEEETARLAARILRAVQMQQRLQAESLAEQSRSPLARMVRSALRHPDRPRPELLQSMEEAASLEMPALERRLPALGAIAHLSPLLGLLGTVTGLVRCFQVIQEKTSSTHPINPADLAGGIWEALLTTVFGLAVAIPAYAAYHYLSDRLNQFTHSLEAASIELADGLTQPRADVASPTN